MARSWGYPHVGESDGALARRAAAGDIAAFEALVDRHYPGCLRYALRMLGERADAEEVVQETFVRAYRALPRYQERDRFTGWLYRILTNRCRSRGARAQRRLRRLIDYRAGLDDPVERPRTPRPDLSNRVTRALLRLPADQREAFLLKYVEELSYDEMADITGAGVSALKMRVKRARDRLQELLKDLHGEEESLD